MDQEKNYWRGPAGMDSFVAAMSCDENVWTSMLFQSFPVFYSLYSLFLLLSLALFHSSPAEALMLMLVLIIMLMSSLITMLMSLYLPVKLVERLHKRTLPFPLLFCPFTHLIHFHVKISLLHFPLSFFSLDCFSPPFLCLSYASFITVVLNFTITEHTQQRWCRSQFKITIKILKCFTEFNLFWWTVLLS